MLRVQPNLQVSKWFSELPRQDTFLSVLSVGEVRYGIERLEIGKRRERLEFWLVHELVVGMGGRILPVTLEIAQCWSKLRATSRRTLPVVDSLIAATAVHHGLRLATRNLRDFEYPELDAFNPFG